MHQCLIPKNAAPVSLDPPILVKPNRSRFGLDSKDTDSMAAASSFQILNNNAEHLEKHPHESFSAARELEARLKSVVKGEVRFDEASRALYATDASNYRQVPIGLVIPKDAADVIATVAACREFGAPVLSRGGGTSVCGQTCNVAVVMDFSKYMRSV